jgi:hypothetical protein
VNDINNKTAIRLEYDDHYATCAATHATLRIFSGEMSPERVTAALCLAPSKMLFEGVGGARSNGWFLSSQDRVDSRDVRRHIDWLLERTIQARTQLCSLQDESGVSMDVFCYWRSTQGHGGPALNPKQMQLLADLNLTVGFDCY